MGDEGIPVLMLHGLCEDVPPWAVFDGTRTCLLRADDFRALLAWCCTNHDVMTLAQAISDRPSSARRPLVLTFDDGMASLIDFGVPLLRERAASATVFVSTSWVDSGQTPCAFELERHLYARRPRALEVTVDGKRLVTKVGGRPGQALRTFWRFLFAERIPMLTLDESHVRLDGSPIEPLEARRDFWFPATWTELAREATAGTLEIGSHLVSHTPVSWLSRDAAETEISESRARIEQACGTGVAFCAYPHGTPAAEGRRTPFERAFARTFTNVPGLMTSATPKAECPRLHVPGEDFRAACRAIALGGRVRAPGLVRRAASRLRGAITGAGRYA